MSKVFFSSLTAFAKAAGPNLINVDRKLPSGGIPCTDASKTFPVKQKNKYESSNEQFGMNS